MARKADTLTLRNQLFVASATIAAHASAGTGGFRQRDVRFFIELFTNWAEADPAAEIVVQNVQVQRYLQSLCDEGYLKQTVRSGQPIYRLMRVGLLELLTRIASPTKPHVSDHFFFLVFFLKGYATRLEDLIKREGAQFPPALRVEVQALLDVTSLVDQEIHRVKKQLKKITIRIDDAKRTRELVTDRLRKGVDFNAIVRELELTIPYELNSKKPLRELISSIDPGQRQWELLEGNRLRSELLWMSQQGMMEGYLGRLVELKRQIG